MQELLRSEDTGDKYLNSHAPIKECLKNGDQIYFHIETMDLWINTDIHLSLMGRVVLQGKAQFKVSKASTFASLRKKLQIFGIKLWCVKNQQPNAENSEDRVSDPAIEGNQRSARSRHTAERHQEEPIQIELEDQREPTL